VSAPLPPSAERVRQALAAAGLAAEIRVLAASTRSAADAAAAVGCSVAQIAKSLVFRARPSDRPVLVVASGTNRVDEAAVAALVGEALAKADAAFVRDRTGFAIGGVAPVGHREPPLVVIDRDLLGFDAIWAAAGTPNAVFRLTPADLVRITGGRVASVAASFPSPGTA
jgi:prolyl-tRNA editing enzyme YbaK/EbsC (Cys-tRNA(Pro) deacylase)